MAVFAGFTGDRSGSMMSMADQAADGLYEFIKSNASNALNQGQQGFISATTFDDTAIVRLDNVPAKDIEISARECREWMKPEGCLVFMTPPSKTLPVSNVMNVNGVLIYPTILKLLIPKQPLFGLL